METTDLCELPVEIWVLIVEHLPRIYGRIARLSRWHYDVLGRDRERFKLAACELIESKLCRSSWYELPNGALHGKYIRYHSTGAVKMECNYVDDMKQGIETWYYKTGAVNRVFNYVNDRKHGVEIEYLKSGAVNYERNYVDNWLDGLEIGYYESGAKRYERRYKSGQIYGFEISYDVSGVKFVRTSTAMIGDNGAKIE